MISQHCAQMIPLYGAMSASSSTIAWLEQQERERSDWELHAHLSKLGSAIQDFLNSKPSYPSDKPTMPTTEFIVCCLGVVTSLTALIVQRVRPDLPNASERFRQPIGFLLDQLEEMVDRMEDIAEAWAIPLDNDLSAKLDAALGQVDSTKTDIPDWRKTLELVSD